MAKRKIPVSFQGSLDISNSKSDSKLNKEREELKMFEQQILDSKKAYEDKIKECKISLSYNEYSLCLYMRSFLDLKEQISEAERKLQDLESKIKHLANSEDEDEDEDDSE